ncbi:MAG: hypothetical protein LBG99_02875 [Propionibacteriaceae bacterium]|nr:hypothetical protein [Propionibacteriaceae bacterium]
MTAASLLVLEWASISVAGTEFPVRETEAQGVEVSRAVLAQTPKLAQTLQLLDLEAEVPLGVLSLSQKLRVPEVAAAWTQVEEAQAELKVPMFEETRLELKILVVVYSRGPEEAQVVLLDAGRSNQRTDPHSDADHPADTAQAH